MITAAMIGAIGLVALICLITVGSVLVQRPRPGYRGNLVDSGGISVVQGKTPYPVARTVGQVEVTGESAAARGAQISASLPKTDFGKQGNTTPVAQYMTTYLYGDDLYDESYPISSNIGQGPLGEVGITIAEAVGTQDHRLVAAFDLWVFDMTDSSTISTILMTKAGHDKEALRQRLEVKGSLHVVVTGEWITVETGSLRIKARVFDFTTRHGGGRFDQAFFERITIEIAVWQKNQPMMLGLTEQLPQLESDAQESQVEGPQVVTHEVKTSYLIRYAERTYLKQPFNLRISIPGELSEIERKRKTQNSVGTARPNPGKLHITRYHVTQHRYHKEEAPTVSVSLSFNEDELHIPTTSATAPFTGGDPLEFVFPVKPLKAEAILLAVKFYHNGKVWVPGKALEVTETKNIKTGEVMEIATKKEPERYTQMIDHLTTETLTITVKALGGMTSGQLGFVTALLGLILIVGYNAWILRLGQIESLLDLWVQIGATAIALILLIVIPTLGGRGNTL